MAILSVCARSVTMIRGARVVREASLRVKVKVRVRVWRVDTRVKEGEGEFVGEGDLRVWVRFTEGVGKVYGGC